MERELGMERKNDKCNFGHAALPLKSLDVDVKKNPKNEKSNWDMGKSG